MVYFILKFMGFLNNCENLGFTETLGVTLKRVKVLKLQIGVNY
jgi:hypothetical protein